MQLWQALFLGILQGFSELFPVSSLGHTILIPAILHWNLNQEANDFLAFLVALHLATATALVIYFWKEWQVVLLAYVGSFKRRQIVYDEPSKFAWLLVAGTILVGAFGLLFEKQLRLLFEDSRFVWVVAVLLILNGGVMLLGDYMRRRSESPAARPAAARGASAASMQSVRVGSVASAAARPEKVEDLNFAEGGVVGAAQILALFPGISRSGATIVAGLLAGLNYEEASRFAFMLATPVIGLAALLKVPDLFKPEARSILAITVPSALLAGITAYLSVRFLMRYFETRRLAPFAYYCVAFGVVALVLVLIGA